MSTLSDSAACSSLLDRLARLTPESPRQWGKMSPHQMVCHVSDAFRMAHGDLQVTDVSNLLTKTVIRFMAISTPMRWPPGAPTVPEADQVAGGGTKPGYWGRDVADLTDFIIHFAGKSKFARHPAFGNMTRSEWMRWGYRHVDHHLRQFGV